LKSVKSAKSLAPKISQTDRDASPEEEQGKNNQPESSKNQKSIERP